jgi:hypothetical protein
MLTNAKFTMSLKQCFSCFVNKKCIFPVFYLDSSSFFYSCSIILRTFLQNLTITRFGKRIGFNFFSICGHLPFDRSSYHFGSNQDGLFLVYLEPSQLLFITHYWTWQLRRHTCGEQSDFAADFPTDQVGYCINLALRQLNLVLCQKKRRCGRKSAALATGALCLKNQAQSTILMLRKEESSPEGENQGDWPERSRKNLLGHLPVGSSQVFIPRWPS